jgi:hypothetical protein
VTTFKPSEITVVKNSGYSDPAPGDESWRAQLRRAGHDVQAKRDLFKAATELRDRRVIEAYDAGATTREIADAALLTQGRVCQVVAEWSAAEGRDKPSENAPADTSS